MENELIYELAPKIAGLYGLIIFTTIIVLVVAAIVFIIWAFIVPHHIKNIAHELKRMNDGNNLPPYREYYYYDNDEEDGGDGRRNSGEDYVPQFQKRQ